MSKLIKGFGKILFEENSSSLSEYAEIGIDAAIENGVIKDIPIVNTIFGLVKTSIAMHERNRIIQMMTFVKEFNSGTINNDKLEKHREKLKDEKELYKELERVLLILESNIDKEKSIILAKLYKAYVCEIISWGDFCEFTDITNRMYMVDFKFLRSLWNNQINESETESDKYRIERIYSAGLIKDKMIMITGSPQGLSNRILSPLGENYCNLIFGEEQNEL